MSHASKNYFLLLDYSLWAITSGRTCTIEARFNSASVSLAYATALKEIDKKTIIAEEIEKALAECGCEYERISKIENEAAVNAIQELHNRSWQDTLHYTYDVCPQTKYVDVQRNAHGLHLGRITPNTFKGYLIEYHIPKKIFATKPQLRALAMILIQALALNQISMLANTYIYRRMG